VRKTFIYSINLIGCCFCFFLLSFFSFHSNAYPATSSYFDTVQKIYIGYYQRPADPGGLIYWSDRLNTSNGNLTDIIDAFANSEESSALYGTINGSSISNVVNNIYLALFNRYADEGGRNYYVNNFNAGKFPDGRRCTAGTIVLDILNGAVESDLLSVNNKLAAAKLFTGTIDPDLDGSNFQATYSGDGDNIAGRNFLTLYATATNVPTQDETTSYIQINIADPFNFAVSSNFMSKSLTMIPGETRNVSVTAALTGDVQANVDLSLSTLPAGVTATFTPSTVSQTGTSTLAITTTPATPIGYSTVTITATNGSQSRTTQFTLDVRSASNMASPAGLVIESGGTTALITDLGRLVRLDLETMSVTKTITNLLSPGGLAIESSGATALVATDNSLVRVSLSTGAVAPIATGFSFPSGVVIETGGATALVTDTGRLSRVTLANGIVRVITANLNNPQGIVIESGGTTALVANGDNLVRVNLSDGLITVLSTRFTSNGDSFAGGIALEAGGNTVIATTITGNLVRVALASGAGTVIGVHFSSSGPALVLEASGNTAIVGVFNRIIRTYLSSTITTVSRGFQTAEDVAIEAGGTTALVVEYGGFGGQPRVLRVDLTNGTTSTIATIAKFGISGIAIEPGGNTALVIADSQYLLRVNLNTGVVTTLTSLLANAFGAGIAIEPGGLSALIHAGAIYRVNLATGALTVLVASVGTGGMAIESGGNSALISTLSGISLQRVNLIDRTVATIASDLYVSSSARGECTAIAIEKGGLTALVTQPGPFSNAGGRILRVNLVTGAVTVIVPYGLSGPGMYTCGVVGIALEASGAAALVADEGNGLVRVSVPAP